MEGDLYGAFGLDGRQWIRYRHTAGAGLKLAAIGQELPLGSNGAKWGVSLLGSQTKADLSGIPVHSDLSAFNLNVTYPWLRRRTYNLTMRGTSQDGPRFARRAIDSFLRLRSECSFIDRSAPVRTLQCHRRRLRAAARRY